ncbi:MAG: flavodoxin family protein [Spirochaetaceae bacterium]|jgi:multimeric flavodoxin WrbA|nr:flavodoxin family protein [Spirochaetaceae bacterium]
MKKVLLINGSPNSTGSTYNALSVLSRFLHNKGLETEVFQLGGNLIRGCQACGVCRKIRNRRCVYNDDIINITIEKMEVADAIIFASPTYFGNVTAEMKALIDRAGYVGRGNQYMFGGKVGAAVVTMGHAGGVTVYNSLNLFFTTNNMPIAPSTYWNIIVTNPDKMPTEVEKATLDNLATNIVEMLRYKYEF